jgi:hypothetical protein
MELVLYKDEFVNNKLLVSYGGNMEALFTIVDEEFAGNNRLGRINVVTCLVRKVNADGLDGDASLCTSVIGLGDGIVGVRSDDSSLRGKLLTQDNMENCVVELYE